MQQTDLFKESRVTKIGPSEMPDCDLVWIRDSVAWHSDDEPELGKNPIIASVSFGATRRFVLKHKNEKRLPKIEMELSHGSLLLMRGPTQHHWIHAIPKSRIPVGPRLNLTFRIIR